MAEEEDKFMSHTVDGVTVVQFLVDKIVDEFTVKEIADGLYRIAETNPAGRLVLDFSNVRFLTSGALGILINLNHKMSKGGGKLVLAAIQPDILEVFKITKLHKVFDIQRNEQAAIDRARK